jgi:mRNA interferase RelE/StbE
MPYRITFKASADKSLDKLPKPLQSRVIRKIQSLALDPRPSGSAKLSGSDDLWRVRTGDWRVVYQVDNRQEVIDVRIIAHRREVYRDL